MQRYTVADVQCIILYICSAKFGFIADVLICIAVCSSVSVCAVCVRTSLLRKRFDKFMETFLDICKTFVLCLSC